MRRVGFSYFAFGFSLVACLVNIGILIWIWNR